MQKKRIQELPRQWIGVSFNSCFQTSFSVFIMMLSKHSGWQPQLHRRSRQSPESRWIPLGLNGGAASRLDGWFLESLISQSSPSAGLFGRANKRLINRQNMFSLLLQSTSAVRKVCATHFDSGGYLIMSLFCPATALKLAWLLLHFLPLSDVSETAAFASRFHQIDWTQRNKHQH